MSVDLRTGDIDEYFTSIDRLERLRGSDYMDVFYAKRLAIGASLDANYLYLNDGPTNSNENKYSRTALAHKILFDKCKGDIRIFAKGFHQNIYGTEIVIKSFRKYVTEVLVPGQKEGTIQPIQMIFNEKRKECFEENRLVSNLLSEAKKLATEFPETTIIEQYAVLNNSKVLITPIVPEKDGNDVLFLDIGKKKVEEEIHRLKSFSVFGSAYRFRQSHHSKNHHAIINFCNESVLKVFKENFDAIKDQCFLVESIGKK